MKKKGIATGLTWMIAMLVILFVSTVFIVAVFFLAKNNIIFGKDDSPIKIPQETGSNLVLEKNLNSFLNRKVEFENKKITILELVENNKIEQGNASKLFIEQAKIQFPKTLPYPTKKWESITKIFDPDPYAISGALLSIHPYWLAVFDKGQTISSDHPLYFAIGGTDCKPLKQESIILTRYVENKKIALCINKEYYKAVEGQK